MKRFNFFSLIVLLGPAPLESVLIEPAGRQLGRELGPAGDDDGEVLAVREVLALLRETRALGVAGVGEQPGLVRQAHRQEHVRAAGLAAVAGAWCARKKRGCVRKGEKVPRQLVGNACKFSFLYV